MPRKKRAATGSAFQMVQKQARGLLLNLRKEIHAKELELKQLKEEETSLGHLAGGVSASRAGGQSTGANSSGRINWRTILEQLPKQFNASHIRTIRGLKGKRPSEIFAAITRWIEAGTVKRKARGLYERV
jgi:hypothetical protein